jgi:hypothetical protein
MVVLTDRTEQRLRPLTPMRFETPSLATDEVRIRNLKPVKNHLLPSAAAARNLPTPGPISLESFNLSSSWQRYRSSPSRRSRRRTLNKGVCARGHLGVELPWGGVGRGPRRSICWLTESLSHFADRLEDQSNYSGPTRFTPALIGIRLRAAGQAPIRVEGIGPSCKAVALAEMAQLRTFKLPDRAVSPTARASSEITSPDRKHRAAWLCRNTDPAQQAGTGNVHEDRQHTSTKKIFLK